MSDVHYRTRIHVNGKYGRKKKMECDRNLCYTAIYNDFSCEECRERNERKEETEMKNLNRLQSYVDSALVSNNIDHTVRRQVLRLFERFDREYVAIDRVLEIINNIVQKSDDVSSYDVGFSKACNEIRTAIRDLKGGE